MEKMVWLLMAVFVVIQFQFDITHCEPLTLTIIEDAVEMGAACIDGSPPGYYYRAGSGEGANKWILHLMGGGWCQTVEDCYMRATTQEGTSTVWGDTIEPYGLLSDDAALNPDFYNWNVVYLMYCDGSSFSGNRLEPVEHEGTELYFRGFLNLQAILNHLVTERSFSVATDVILTGCSAGGLSTLLHANFVKSTYAPNAKFRGLPDAGYFIVIYNMAEIGPDKFITMMDLHNISESIMPECRANYDEDELWRCLYAPFIYEYIDPPIYVLNSRMDLVVLLGILISPDSSVTVSEYPAEYDAQSEVVFNDDTSGYFLNSCYDHCQSLTITTHDWNDHKINDISIQESFGDWYFERSDGSTTRLKDDCDDACNPTCSLF